MRLEIQFETPESTMQKKKKRQYIIILIYIEF